MRSLVISVLALAACGNGGSATPMGGPDAPVKLPSDAPTPDAPVPDAAPPSITDWLTQDPTPLLSMAGVYDPTGVPGTALIRFSGVVKLGADQLEGILLGGFSIATSGVPGPDVTPVDVALLAQQPDGTLARAESTFLPSTMTHGVGSVNVADFNGDGKDDIFLSPYNESPFKYESTTVYLSKPDGTFDKITLADSVQNHDANIAIENGKPIVMATTYNLPDPPVPSSNGIYRYDGHGGFALDGGAGTMCAASVAGADFLGTGDFQVVYGDVACDPVLPYSMNNQLQQFVYRYVNGKLVTPGGVMPTPYFDKPQYANLYSNWDPASKTHNSRLWVDDLNHDGLPDVVVNAEVWDGVHGEQRNALQILINKGQLSFEDDTDTLNPDLDQQISIDYSMRLADVDGSGIVTYFEPGWSFCLATDPACIPKQGGAILLNDGSGRLHVAMHDEFENLGGAVNRMAAAQFPANVDAAGPPPQFIAYQTPNGRTNFLAVLIGHFTVAGGVLQKLILVNVPLQIDLATEYRANLAVNDRNGSHLIRTFAGDDTIYAGHSGGHCTVDGGAGTDTVIYSGPKANYTVTRTAGGWTVKDNVGSEGTDTLKNVEILQFADGTMR